MWQFIHHVLFDPSRSVSLFEKLECGFMLLLVSIGVLVLLFVYGYFFNKQ